MAMGSNILFIFVCLYLVLDTFLTIFFFGLYQPNFQYNPKLILNFLSLSGGYDFLKNPIDFAIFSVIRLFITLLGIYIRVCHTKASLKNCSLPLLAVFILSWTLSLIKLLAFSETVGYLLYIGVWLSCLWNVISPLLLISIWWFSLHCYPESYRPISTTTLNRDAEGTSAVDSQSDWSKIRRGALSHAFRLLKYCNNHWQWFSAGFLFLIIYSVARIFIPYYTGRVIANIVQQRKMSLLIKSVLVMSGLTMISAIFGGLRGGTFTYATGLVHRQMRCDLFHSLVKQEIGFFDTTKTGEITSRLTADCQTMSNMVSTNVNVFLRNFVMLVGALVFMFTLSWQLSMVTFIMVPVVGFITKLYGAYYDKLSEQTQTSIASANQVADEVLGTMRTVRSFACETREAKRFDHYLDETVHINKKKSIAYMGYTWTNEFCDNAILVAVLFYGGHLVLGGRMTPDDLISFLLYQMQLGENFYNLGYVFTGLMECVGASRKVFDYMLREPKVLNNGTVTSENLQGSLRFDAVSFTYPSRPNNIVLQNVTFDVKPGETVALVGPSGGGKSSIVSLIEHFYECDKGKILLDGIPVNDYDHEYLHRKIALVAQEPVLYEGTVRYNITYGCDSATDNDVLEAARMANVHDFVMEMEKGYDTNCGEKGVQLSGGQKQRIAIARALVRKPAVLILDEATSALDSESEHIVQEAIGRCSKERTVIVIAHRLSTVEKADRIIVIEKGKVVQQGRHDDLLKEEGLYRSLVRRQLFNHG
ncbi:hypothetical protein AB6A40_005641 [Gnathostoma spinigerum]|uniref:ABC-type antigen peptide transporter n=1 Tax=Gnathostoma spinigerum TaxID=75299 RepID=A0ABD6EQH1_9BILA